MAQYAGEWPTYVRVADRKKIAKREATKLRKKGYIVSPVTIEGRAIATTFWGQAWCSNLESYHDFATRLPRGRTYVRNGSVFDLQVNTLGVKAMVTGSDIYNVSITIKEVTKKQWQAICRDSAGAIDSLVELLQGQLSKGVMERLCHQATGLFPKPSEIFFHCSCPDDAAMCKHIAAVLYGVGARLDTAPELLFRLRGVDPNDLVSDAKTTAPLTRRKIASKRILASSDVEALFGLTMKEDPDITTKHTTPRKPKPPR